MAFIMGPARKKEVDSTKLTGTGDTPLPLLKRMGDMLNAQKLSA